MDALAYTLGAFALILVLARLKVPLAAAIFAGAIGLGVLFGLGPAQVALAVAKGILQGRTLGLMAITVALLALSGTMQAAGQMAEIVLLAKALFRRPAVTMAALPALIGLLPMPGGALFSAPMVESAAAGANISGGLLSAINYWFRHIWEHWWPLYPGVILAVALTGSDFATFIAFQLPLGVFMAASGLPLLLRAHGELHPDTPPPPAGTWGKLLLATAPIWIIIVAWLAVAGLMKLLPDRPVPASMQGLLEFAPISVGLVASLVWTTRHSGLKRAAIRHVWINRNICAMVALVAGVMVFQYVIQHVGATVKIGEELTELHVPVAAVVVILPLIAGMVTGLAVGFVGTSFPIVLGLVGAMPEAASIRPYLVLAYAFGHLGQMISPLHLCHVVSNRYFRTGFAPVYRQIWLPALLTAVLAAGYFVLLKALMG